jgi:hypothetical protein
MEESISLERGSKIVHNKYSVCHTIGTGNSSTVYSISLKKKGKNIIRAVKVVFDCLNTVIRQSFISPNQYLNLSPQIHRGYSKR